VAAADVMSGGIEAMDDGGLAGECVHDQLGWTLLLLVLLVLLLLLLLLLLRGGWCCAELVLG
jgi:hypothetical protein